MNIINNRPWTQKNLHFLEVMVNNLVFRWPNLSFSRVLGVSWNILDKFPLRFNKGDRKPFAQQFFSSQFQLHEFMDLSGGPTSEVLLMPASRKEKPQRQRKNASNLEDIQKHTKTTYHQHIQAKIPTVYVVFP